MTSWLNEAIADLAEKGYYHGHSVFSPEMVVLLNQWIDRALAAGEFSRAGIGKDAARQTNDAVRGDLTLWIPDESDKPVISDLLVTIGQIRDVINRELFAGLRTFEGHFAVYPPGGFYKKHMDTFRVDDARHITLILYLNQNWQKSDGGQLRLYTDDDRFEDVEPRAGTVVLFRSRDFPHEVLPALTDRRSFTGWYKTSSAVI